MGLKAALLPASTFGLRADHTAWLLPSFPEELPLRMAASVHLQDTLLNGCISNTFFQGKY